MEMRSYRFIYFVINLYLLVIVTLFGETLAADVAGDTSGDYEKTLLIDLELILSSL